MSRDEGQTVLPDGRDNYETVVLDFLNKEMASVQPDKTKSDDLDALVADLLKQAITESEQPPNIRPAASKDLNDMLSEFPPTLLEGVPANQEIAEITSRSQEFSTSETFPVEDKQEAATKPAEIAPAMQPSTLAAEPLFATPAASKSKTPMIVMATVCLLAVISCAAYYFLSSSKDIPNGSESKPALAMPVLPYIQAPALPSTKQSATNSSTKQAPIAPKAAPPTAHLAAKPQPARPTSTGNTSLPPLPQNEKPSLIQESLPIATATPGSALDKLVSISASSTPAPEMPKAPAAPRNSAASNSQPVVSGTLVMATPISQVTPKYPALAVKMHASAAIVLDLVIDEKGNVIQVTPVSGPALFYKEAVDAAMKWRYRPASLGGVNVKSQARITMNFKLK
jgi:protein TonB